MDEEKKHIILGCLKNCTKKTMKKSIMECLTWGYAVIHNVPASAKDDEHFNWEMRIKNFIAEIEEKLADKDDHDRCNIKKQITELAKDLKENVQL